MIKPEELYVGQILENYDAWFHALWFYEVTRVDQQPTNDYYGEMKLLGWFRDDGNFIRQSIGSRQIGNFVLQHYHISNRAFEVKLLCATEYEICCDAKN